MLTRTGSADERQAHTRRWLVLGVMCLSLLLIVMDNTIVNVALPDVAARPRRQHHAAAVGGGRLHPGLRRAAAHHGLARRPLREAGCPCHRAVGHGHGVDPVVVRQQCRSAHRHPGADGRRRRADHARHPLDHHQCVHRPQGARPGHRHLVGDGRRRRRHRPGHRRLAAGALLVGIGLPGQRARRGGRAGARPAVRAHVAGPGGAARSTWSAPSCRSLGWWRWCGRSSRAPGGWTDPAILGAFALGRRAARHLRPVGAAHPLPMLDISFFRNPRFSAASGAIMLTFFAMFGSLFLLTQFLQSVLGYTPLEAGIRLLPMAGVMLVISPLSAPSWSSGSVRRSWWRQGCRLAPWVSSSPAG